MNGSYEYGSPSIGRTMTPHLPDFTEETCLNWMNQQLAKARPPLAISILTEPNVRNGVALGLLLETVGQIKLNGLLLQPETRVEHLHNVHELFALMRQINVRLGTIQPENVMNGDKESILQLVQAISNHFKRHPRGRRSVSPHPYSTNSDRAAVYQNASTGSNAISKHAINGNCGPHKLHRNHSLIGGHCNGYAQSHGTVVASEEGATKSITALTVMLNGHRAKGTIHRSERSYD
ncbi:unnamed protein product [Dicrocoelium dendriticum]|nr:unnamed protein product [Dicrocoelium dendriticum]